MKRIVLACALALVIAIPAFAHEVRPARLIVTELSEGQYLVRWKVPAVGDRALAITPSFDPVCESEVFETDNLLMGASVRTWSFIWYEGIVGK